MRREDETMKRLSIRTLGDGAFCVGLGTINTVVNANDRSEALRLGKAKLRDRMPLMRAMSRRIDRVSV